jgi:hypothetical protein
LAADEPPDNAQIVCSLYLSDEQGRRCRRVVPEDLTTDPLAPTQIDSAATFADTVVSCRSQLVDPDGYSYRLETVRKGTSMPELRWHAQPSRHDNPNPLSVRQVIGSLESYEPARTMSAQAVAIYGRDDSVSVSALRNELARVDASRIVLNRGLREAALAAVKERGVSLSEIAIRCGRVKRDTNGAASGETSWLGRRLGTLPEGGKSAPTPWVSSEVLALIAREGLGISPRDVELD